MIRVYEIVFLILFILFFPFLFLFSRVRSTVFKRLFFNRLDEAERESIWFHGASAGDILSIKPIIDLFYSKYRDRYNILITSNTESGRDIVLRYLPSDVIFSYLPFDIFISVNNFLKKYRPKVLLVESSEFWPVLIDRSYRFGARIVLINGNIKREKVLYYKFLAMISSNPFLKYELMILRNSESYEMARYLGVDESHLLISTNTKYKNVFDMKDKGIPDEIQKRFGNISRMIVFGSVHYEEEEEIIRVIYRLVKVDESVRIIFAPRHIERVEQIIKRFNALNLAQRVCKFTERTRDADIIVLNTIGDLFYIYPFARLAFVGGSLADRGGHNVLEPAVWGVPVITGRYVRNFEEIVRSLLGFGLIMVNDENELYNSIVELLNDEEKRRHLSQMISEKTEKMRGDFVNIEELFLSRFRL
ncbi:MAG: 3-deoxy-D-manno-octulosonic acid transferase [Myxococcota bacterium]